MDFDFDSNSNYDICEDKHDEDIFPEDDIEQVDVEYTGTEYNEFEEYHDDEEFKWTDECTKMYLKLCTDRLHLLRDPKIKKYLIWNQIKDIFKDLGYNVKALSLAGKFRSMKRTYKEIYSKKCQNENYRSKWKYYDEMGKILNKLYEEQEPGNNEESGDIFVSEYNVIQTFDWTHETILLLLNAYKDRKIQFYNYRRINTNILWKEIRDIFTNDGHIITEEMLVSKYRMLKHSYYKIKVKQSKRGLSNSKWAYYGVFQEITNIPEDAVFLGKKESNSSNKELDDSEAEKKAIWSDEAVTELLTLYNEKKQMFRNPNIKNCILWKQISNTLCSIGYNVSAGKVDNKFRNLKSTFRNIEHKALHSKSFVTLWPYYNKMLEIFNDTDTDFLYESDDIPDETNMEEPSEHNNWPNKATILMLNAYKERHQQFSDRKIKRKTLWKEIEIELRDAGYSYSEEMIDKKFRNLKVTFIKINKKYEPKKYITWPYHKIMLSVLNPDGTLKEMTTERPSLTIKIEDDIWTSYTIQLLLDSFWERKNDFYNPDINDYYLWKEIARIFANHGYILTEDMLTSKFKSLCDDYNNNKSTISSSECAELFEFHDLLTKICDKEASIEIDSSLHEDKTFKWTNETTKLLLNCYLERRFKFELWKEISEIFQHKGIEVSPENLKMKFNTLKKSYYITKDKLLNCPSTENDFRNSSKWKVHKLLKKIFDETDLDVETDDFSNFQFVSTNKFEEKLSSCPSSSKQIKLSSSSPIPVVENLNNDSIQDKLISIDSKLDKIYSSISKQNNFQKTTNDILNKILIALEKKN